jgi:hypothetical protein
VQQLHRDFFSFHNISLIATLNDSLYDIEKKINHKIKEIKDKKKKTNQRTKTVDYGLE